MLLVNHERVETALDECLAAGIRAFVVPGIGAESGAAGKEVIERVARPRPRGRRDDDRAELHGRGDSRRDLDVDRAAAGDDRSRARRGASRSRDRSPMRSSRSADRIGLRYVISAGAEAATGAADYLHHFAQDEGTRAVGLFLEAVREPARFVEGLAACAAAGKPVVCLKVGRSEAAARAALSHTGALVGSGHAFSAVLRRHGAIEVDDFHELARDARDPRTEALARADRGSPVSPSPAASAASSPIRPRPRGSPSSPSRPRARRPPPGALPELPRSWQPARFLGGRRGRGDLPRLARAPGGLG